MNDLISVLVPTYGRPERLRACVKSVYDTATRPGSVEVLVRVDASDPRHKDYIKVLEGMWGATRSWHVAQTQSYGRGIEFLRKKARGDILFAGADDVMFRTKGWDDRVRAVFGPREDGLLVAYANNGRDREDRKSTRLNSSH